MAVVQQSDRTLEKQTNPTIIYTDALVQSERNKRHQDGRTMNNYISGSYLTCVRLAPKKVPSRTTSKTSNEEKEVRSGEFFMLVIVGFN